MAESLDALAQHVEKLSLKDKVKAEGQAAEEIIFDGKKLVFLILETTGFEKDCDIIKISAIHGRQEFDQYILPSKEIFHLAGDANGLELKNGELYDKGQPVVSTNAKEAMKSFVDFLSHIGEGVVLVAHNGRRFHERLLLQVMNLVGVQLPANVDGFQDSLLLARNWYPNRASCTLQGLVHDILGLALKADAKIMQSLMGAMLRDIEVSKQQTAWGKYFKPINRGVAEGQ